MKIALIGHIHFAKKLKVIYNKLGHESIAYDYSNWGRTLVKSISDVKKVDTLHFIGGVGIRKFIYIFILKYIYKKKIFVHFVGSDVTRLIKSKVIDKLNWLMALKLANRVFCVSKWLSDELQPIINTETFPIFFNSLNTEFYEFPKTFTILCYLPDSRANFYGESQIEILVKNNPNIQFIIFGGERLKKYSNVENIQINYNLDMKPYYKRSSLLIRLTQHDGLSNMVLEALAMNRHVIWSNKFPFVQYVSFNSNEIQKIINSLQDSNANEGASDWIFKNFNQVELINKLLNLYENPEMKVNNEI